VGARAAVDVAAARAAVAAGATTAEAA
jgi:hypothetical protein